MAQAFSADRIMYMRMSLTRGQIQKLTGIHWKTQEAVLAGTRFLDQQQKARLHSEYSKTAYKSMREDGFSVKQATQYRGYTPFSVIDTQLKFQQRVTEIAEHGITMKYYGKSNSFIMQKLAEEKASFMQAIRQSNYDSKHNFEYFIEHGT